MANYSTPGAKNIRMIVRSAYDHQKLRIETGNRICANFRSKLGIESGETEDGGAKKVLTQLRIRYKRITDGITKITRRRKYDYDGVITDYSELSMLDSYFQLEKTEQQLFRTLGHSLDQCPIWTEFLTDVKGVGPAMAGVIISEMDPHRAKYPSSFHAYAGLDVADDGKGRSRRSEHLVEHEYEDADGEIQTRKGISFNPFLKTKLMGVLSGSFLRAGREDNRYREVYDRYRNRLENREDLQDESDGHIHNMSLRYMIKDFLIDLYIVWRDLEDLPVAQLYHVKYLGKDDHGREERLGLITPKRFPDEE